VLCCSMLSDLPRHGASSSSGSERPTSDRQGRAQAAVFQKKYFAGPQMWAGIII
jgi:hypothetical protein